jgi:hypothetical protein
VDLIDIYQRCIFLLTDIYGILDEIL